MSQMPQFSLNQCAYHPNQQLTNFCTCVQCLLPVCPTCIKVHTEQHLQKGTHPEFQKLDAVFTQVHQSCGDILQGLQRLKEQLLQVQKVKKQNESLILQKIKLYRNKLIRQFQRQLIQLQHQIVQKFQQQDEGLIKEIQQIDIKIDKMQQSVQQEMLCLQKQQGLRRMIFSLSENYEIKWLKELTLMNERIKDMLKRNVYLQVEEGRVEEVKQAVVGYMRLGVMEWGIGGRQRGQGHTNERNNTSNAELTAFARDDSGQSQKSINSGVGSNQFQNHINGLNASKNPKNNHYYV